MLQFKKFHKWVFTDDNNGDRVVDVFKKMLSYLDIPSNDPCCTFISDPDNLTNRELTTAVNDLIENGASSNDAWKLAGNTIGTGDNFMGSLDNKDVNFIRNDDAVMSLTTTGLVLAIGKGFQFRDGTEGAGRYLISDEDGVATWTDTQKPNIVTFTSSGTYSPSLGAQYIKVQVQGAGGGSAALEATGANRVATAGGGGAYVEAYIQLNDIVEPFTVTVGAKGVGGVVSNTNPLWKGTKGGNSTFADNNGTILTAEGGNGGDSRGTQAASGVGGNTIIVDTDYAIEIMRKVGKSGTYAYNLNVMGADGGDSFLGFGGTGIDSTAYAAATGYGGGANGSYRRSADANGEAGTDGTDGIVIITEYFI